MDNIFKGLDILINKQNKKIFLDGKDVKLLVDGLDKQALKIALEILDVAQSKVPVDTGYLKSRGNIRQVSYGYEVFYDCDYALYVHENLDANHPRGGSARFLADAYEEVMRKWGRM